MKRGDIVIVREPGTPASKARPCLIVLRDSALPVATKITLCPLTSELRGVRGQRPFVAPSAMNGLTKPSEVQVDWIYTVWLDSIDRRIGRLDDATMEAVGVAMRHWFELN